jgi:hypothetical protein
VLRDLREVIASGTFIHTQEERACKFCRHGHACGKDARDIAKAKLARPEAALESYRRLASHD